MLEKVGVIWRLKCLSTYLLGMSGPVIIFNTLHSSYCVANCKLQITDHRVGNHTVRREFGVLTACFTIRTWRLSISIQHHVHKAPGTSTGTS